MHLKGSYRHRPDRSDKNEYRRVLCARARQDPPMLKSTGLGSSSKRASILAVVVELQAKALTAYRT